MRTVGLFEAKQKLSELVERSREGEKIGTTRRRKLAAVLVPVAPEASLKDIFKDIREDSKTGQIGPSREHERPSRGGPDLNDSVLDASIALRWFLDHPMPVHANRMKRFFLKGFRAVVPALWHLEMSNGLAVAERTPTAMSFLLGNR